MCLFLNSPQLLGFSVSNQLLICIILGPIQVLGLSSTTIIARSAVLRVRLNRNQALEGMMRGASSREHLISPT